jgi:hypothetical protein
MGFSSLAARTDERKVRGRRHDRAASDTRYRACMAEPLDDQDDFVVQLEQRQLERD